MAPAVAGLQANGLTKLYSPMPGHVSASDMCTFVPS